MNSIRTIADLKVATPKEIKEALDSIRIKSDLDQYLRWLNGSSGQRTSTSFTVGYGNRGVGIHPSSACKKGVCQLSLYFEAKGDTKENTHEPKLLFTFDVGTAFHALLQMHLQHMYGERYRKEVPCRDPKLHITGNTDGEFTFIQARSLLEIKTIKEGGNFGFEKVLTKPFDDHIRQTHIYMWCLQVPFGLIFYYNKNTSDIIEHPIVFNPVLWAELEAVIQPVATALEGGPLPPAKVGSHCKGCAFFKGCKPGQEGVNAHAEGQDRDSRRRWGRQLSVFGASRDK